MQFTEGMHGRNDHTIVAAGQQRNPRIRFHERFVTIQVLSIRLLLAVRLNYTEKGPQPQVLEAPCLQDNIISRERQNVSAGRRRHDYLSVQGDARHQTRLS